MMLRLQISIVSEVEIDSINVRLNHNNECELDKFSRSQLKPKKDKKLFDNRFDPISSILFVKKRTLKLTNIC